MKAILLFLYLFAIHQASGQERYHLQFRETMQMATPDSAFKKMKDDFLEKGFSEEIVSQLIAQIRGKLTFTEANYPRILDAGPDSTFILIKTSESTGNLKLTGQNGRMLYAKSTFYNYDPVKNTWIAPLDKRPVKDFVATGNSKKILEYACTEYKSTDSTVRIWVCPALPSYINPGVRVGSINGAVLAFEINDKELPFKRAELEKIIN